MLQSNNYFKLILHEDFHNTIKEIQQRKIEIPDYPISTTWDFGALAFSSQGKLSEPVEGLVPIPLNAKNGERLNNSGLPIAGYDESIDKYASLEGQAFITSHCLTIHGKNDFIPANFISFYFFTRAKKYKDSEKHYITYTEKPEVESKIRYHNDREKFLEETIPDNMNDNLILFIDGILLGSQMSEFSIRLNDKLLQKKAIPIFIVKNSDSQIITENSKILKDNYNSDLHWAHSILKPGERTGFFKYTDPQNERFSKFFCYLKCLEGSPQRIEIHSSTYEKYADKINEIMDLAYYLILCQGNEKNPQIRTIAIAEQYARATLKLFNIRRLMKELGITSTMNQERFGWG
jgi:hypothetical protein